MKAIVELDETEIGLAVAAHVREPYLKVGKVEVAAVDGKIVARAEVTREKPPEAARGPLGFAERR